MNESWIKETMAIIEDLERQKTEVDSKIAELRSQGKELADQIVAADALIRFYRNKHKMLPVTLQDIHNGYFGDKSYPEILKEIALKSGGYFKVLDATEIMLQAGVSNKRRAIQANIYAVLRRMKKNFVKVTKGEYRYTNGLQKPTETSIRTPIRSHSGIQAAIKNLKDKNPRMTKKEVLNHLIETEFDFKGKKPVNAVNIVWAKLGYYIEGKQQSLPGVT